MQPLFSKQLTRNFPIIQIIHSNHLMPCCILWASCANRFVTRSVVSTNLNRIFSYRYTGYRILDIVTITLWQNRVQFLIPNVILVLELELSPCDKYRLATFFRHCPEVVTVSDNQCINWLIIWKMIFVRQRSRSSLLILIFDHFTSDLAHLWFWYGSNWKVKRASRTVQSCAVTVTPSEIWISQEPWQVSQNGFGSS